MTSRSIFLGCLITAIVVITVVGAKPNVKPVTTYFNTCRRSNQKQLNECVKKSIAEAAPLLKKGIPGLGLVPLEPLVIPRMEFDQGEGSFALRTVLSIFTIHGLSAYTVTSADMKFNKDKLVFDLAMSIPSLNMTADYQMDGQILVVPIRGNGNCEMNFTDIVTIAHTLGHIVNRDGREFIEVDSVEWDIAINGAAHMWFYNLFNGDKQLGDGANNFLNNNRDEAFQAVKHLPEEAFGQLFKDLSSRVYNKYSVDELFLD